MGFDEIPVLTLEPQLEKMLMQTVQQSQQSGIKNEEALILEPQMAEQLQASLRQSGGAARGDGKYAYFDCICAYTAYVSALYALWYGQHVGSFLSRGARP